MKRFRKGLDCIIHFIFVLLLLYSIVTAWCFNCIATAWKPELWFVIAIFFSWVKIKCANVIHGSSFQTKKSATFLEELAKYFWKDKPEFKILKCNGWVLPSQLLLNTTQHWVLSTKCYHNIFRMYTLDFSSLPTKKMVPPAVRPIFTISTILWAFTMSPSVLGKCMIELHNTVFPLGGNQIFGCHFIQTTK